MEQLYLSVPLTHPYATRKEIKLAELANLTMLLRSDLGIWQPLVNQLTQTKFIVQKDWAAFVELVNASATFYTSVLKKNKAILQELVKTK